MAVEEELLLDLKHHKRRDQCLSIRMSLNNDFLSPRSSALATSSTVTEGNMANIEREHLLSRMRRHIMTSRKEKSSGLPLLQDSLRSRYTWNSHPKCDAYKLVNWTRHSRKDMKSKAQGYLEKRLMEQGIMPVYDPERNKQDHDKWCRQDLPDVLDMRIFLNCPGPKSDGFFRCYIQREISRNKLHFRYQLYLSEGRRFLLSARKRRKSKTSNYIISLDETDISNKTGNYFGKLRSNFFGTEFLLYDKGERPLYNKCSVFPMNVRAELATIRFSNGILGLRGHKKMTVIVPAIGPDGKAYVFRPILGCSDSILQKYKGGFDLDKMIVMQSRLSTSDEENQAYCLNFGVHANLTPFGKYQLVLEGSKDTVILQFGKAGTNCYMMDYKYPLSAMQAFAICLSSLDKRFI